MRAKKPQKAVAGKVTKSLDKVREVSAQRRNEVERHGIAMQRLAAKAAAANSIGDPIARQHKVIDVNLSRREEDQRHKAKLDTLDTRLRKARTD